jgi:ParB family chromosome partitioning protein
VAVQELLLASPRKASEVAAVRAVLALKAHPALAAFERAEEKPLGYSVVAGLVERFASLLGFETRQGEGESLWFQFPPMFTDDVALYRAVTALSDHDLSELHTLLAALTFGQADCDQLDCGGSLFNAVARDLGTDMKSHWRPDRTFFERRTRDQLLGIAEECGCAEAYSAGMLRSYKKSELVGCLARHFETAREAEKPNEAQAKALAWLPAVMLFPAVNPDADAPEEGEPQD